MRILTRSILLASATATGLFAIAACGEDTLVNPTYGAACQRGQLRSGAPVRGALNEDSCVEPVNLWSENAGAYDSYATRLQAGAAYFIRLSPRPDPLRNGRDGLYPILTVWGRGDGGTPLPLALSSGDGDDRDSELFFVSDRSGTVQTVATSYDDATEYDYLGGYELSLVTCPVLKLQADTGTTALTLKESPCVRGTADRAEYGGDTLAYNFITIRTNPNERISLQFTAQDFTPAFEAFGPDIDTYANLSENSYLRYVGEESRSIEVYGDGGTLTIAIGAVNVTGPSKQFSMRVARFPLLPN